MKIDFIWYVENLIMLKPNECWACQFADQDLKNSFTRLSNNFLPTLLGSNEQAKAISWNFLECVPNIHVKTYEQTSYTYFALLNIFVLRFQTSWIRVLLQRGPQVRGQTVHQTTNKHIFIPFKLYSLLYMISLENNNNNQ